jgi:hypothetical protein
MQKLWNNQYYMVSEFCTDLNCQPQPAVFPIFAVHSCLSLSVLLSALGNLKCWIKARMPKDSDVPVPGPARLSPGAGPDEWLEQAKQCKYLPEADMKKLCEIVKECLMEGSS